MEKLTLNNFYIVSVELSSDSWHSRILLTNVAIESAHYEHERNVYVEWIGLTMSRRVNFNGACCIKVLVPSYESSLVTNLLGVWCPITLVNSRLLDSTLHRTLYVTKLCS